MAIIYGMADSEKNLLKKLPGEVRNYEDMDRVKRDFENKIKQEDDGFFAGFRKWNYQRQVNKFEKNEIIHFMQELKEKTKSLRNS